MFWPFLRMWPVMISDVASYFRRVFCWSVCLVEDSSFIFSFFFSLGFLSCCFVLCIVDESSFLRHYVREVILLRLSGCIHRSCYPIYQVDLESWWETMIWSSWVKYQDSFRDGVATLWLEMTKATQWEP